MGPIAELAIELGEERPAARQSVFHADGRERQIVRRCRSKDNEGRRTKAKRGEVGRCRRICDLVMGIGKLAEQINLVAVVNGDQPVAAYTKLATVVGRGAAVEVQRKLV